MRGHVIAATGKHSVEWKLAMDRADGRCQAVPDTVNRCPAVATEVVHDTDGAFRAFCRECRLEGVGLSAAERGAKTKAFKARQVPLFPEEK